MKISRRRLLEWTGAAGVAGLVATHVDAAAKLNAAAAGKVTIGGDLRVNRMGFGALRILGPGLHGYPKDPAEARRVLRRAVDLGVNLIDTADAYGPYVSEELIYQALYPYPKGLVIATKGGLIRPGPNPEDSDGSPEHLRQSCEGSLKRLHLERIDLYQLHIPDPKRPIEESIGELKRLRDEGKIRHIGVSNVSLDQLQRSQKVAPIVSVQNRYNVNVHASDDVLSFCEAHGLVFLPWAPLGRVVGQDPQQAPDSVDHLAALEAKYNISPQQAALAWLLARSKNIAVIPGTSAIDHLEANIAAASIRFSRADMAAVS